MLKKMKKLTTIILAVFSSTILFSQTTFTLQQCKDLALKNNVILKNSALEIEAAEHVKKNAFTNYFPKVSVTGLGMYAIDPLLNMNMAGGDLPVYNGNPANLPTATQFAYMPDVSIGLFEKMGLGLVSVTQPIYVGGKIVNGNKLAKINVEVKNQLQKMTTNEVLIKTEQQYWQLISIQEKQKTLDQYNELLKDIAKQVNDAYKSGLVIKNDVLKVKLKQSELQINQNKLNNGKKLALMQFCQTIGVLYDSTLVMQDDLQTIETPNTYFIVNDSALTDRTEYQLLNQSIEAAKLQTKMKRGDYLPQLAVGVDGYYNDPLTRGVDGVTNGFAFATLSIPISDWWGGHHAIKELKIREQIAENTFNDTKDLLNLQMEKAWIDVNEAYQQVLIIEEMVIQSDENLKVNEDSYNNGVVTLSNLLEAQALKVAAADKLIEAKTQYRLAISNYLQVTAR